MKTSEHIGTSHLWLAGNCFHLRPEKAFSVCGSAGLVIAVLFSMAIGVHLDLSATIVGVMGVASFATLLAMGMLAKILTGSETLIYYRDIVAICMVDGALLWILHRPVLRYLDIAVLGFGVFLAFGRVGCLSVGCCHGRPARWGICYGEEHARCGFPAHYVGVKLFPVQALESVFVFCLVAAAARMAWVGAEPGKALAFYAVGYGVGRFVIEFARGDADRPYFSDFSEAQWTSLILVWGVVFAEWRNILPSVRLHAAAAIVLTACIVLVAIARRFDRVARFRLRHPKHVRELAFAIRELADSGNVANSSRGVTLYSTSCGIVVSGGMIHGHSCEVQNYCVSKAGSPLTQREAELLARVIGLLQSPQRNFRLLSNSPGVFHLLAEEKAKVVERQKKAVVYASSGG
jgi:prolipoprotein diacylglyceryltransferase